MFPPGTRNWVSDSFIESTVQSTESTSSVEPTQSTSSVGVRSRRGVVGLLCCVSLLVLLPSCASRAPSTGEAGIRASFTGAGTGAEVMKDATAGSRAPLLAGFPEEALDLLTQSTRDSCSICADRNREKAFRLLDSFYAPGTILTTGPEQTFLAAGEEELTLSSYRRDAPKLTLRFHTASEHLVGVDSTDYTGEEWASHLKENPEANFDGMIQMIEYAYGDGPTYLYFPSENHLQLQCKVLELSTR